MKYLSATLIGLLSLCIVFAIGCKKENPAAEDIFVWSGFGNVRRNNEMLELLGAVSKATKYHNKISIVFEHFNSSGAKRGSLAFRHCPFQEGIYYPSSLTGSFEPAFDSLFSVSYHTLRSDGDVAGDVYSPLDTSTNFFSIDSLNPLTKEITGRFSLLMKKDTTFHGEQDPSAPDFINFTNGSYYAKVNQ